MDDQQVFVRELIRKESSRLYRVQFWRLLCGIWGGYAILVCWSISDMLKAVIAQSHEVYEIGTAIPAQPPFWRDVVERIPWAAIGVLALTCWPVMRALRKATVERQAAELAIGGIDDIASVGPLSELLDAPDRATRALTAIRLRYLLARMRPADAHMLTDADHHRLNGVFTARDASLALAVLSAWQQVGDERDLLLVQYVSEGLDIGSRDAEVREAALECLPYLRTRAEARKSAASLLRPAESGIGEQAFLRPAGRASGEHEAVLLRSSKAD